jgi:diguanylate cyclase
MSHSKPFADFSTASKEVLAFLHSRFGFGLWMVTRTEGEDWIVLHSEDHGYGVKEGDVFRWTDSFCSRMVDGLGPCIAADSKQIPAYAEAPIGTQVPIGAYIGIPLEDGDGELFGTLCAIDPSPKDPSLEAELPLIRLLGRLLSTCLAAELVNSTNQRRLLHSELFSSVDNMVDKETGSLKPHAWGKVIAAEENRCQRLGNPAYVIRIRCSQQDPNFISMMSSLSQKCLEVTDVVGRVSDDEFLVLASESGKEVGASKLQSIESYFSSLKTVRVHGASRDPKRSLHDAIEETAKSMI